MRMISGPKTVTSIFLGGGTPSLMKPETVGAILDGIARTWHVPDGIEITMEANPSSVEAERFRGYRATGVNRVSMGVQALNDRDLKFLGRLHDVADALKAIKLAREIFPRMSFDLIYARPNQTVEEWERELKEAISYAVDHLSLYQLTIEEGTPFYGLHKAGKLIVPDGDQSALLYEATQEITEREGMPAYEVSNHARPGAESRHNLTYWRSGDYAGIGAGAHGRRLGMRTARHKKPENFLSAIARNGHGIADEAPLSAIEAADEALVMGLRLTEGIDTDAIARRFGLAEIVDWRRVERLAASGHLDRQGPRIALTAKGRLLLDHILGEIAAPVPLGSPRVLAVA